VVLMIETYGSAPLISDSTGLDYHLISSKNKLFLGKIKLEINAAYQFNNRKLYGMDKYVVDMSLQAINHEVKTQIANTKKLSIITGLQGNYIQSKNANAPIEIIPNYYTNDFSLFVLSWNPKDAVVKARNSGIQVLSSSSDAFTLDPGAKKETIISTADSAFRMVLNLGQFDFPSIRLLTVSKSGTPGSNKSSIAAAKSGAAFRQSA